MPKPTLGSIYKAIPDPLLSDNYQFHIPNVPTSGTDDQPLLIQCRTFNKPGVTINAVEVQLFGHTVEYAGNKTFSHDLSIEYVENRMVQITQILEYWANLARGTQSQHGAFKNEYARDGLLTVFDQKGDIVVEYVVENCWPTTVPEISFDGSASNLISVPAGFKYDIYYNRTSGVGFENATNQSAFAG